MQPEAELNSVVGSIPPSATLRITSRAKEMRAAGRDVCSFAAGEPDFDTPDNVKQAAVSALAAGETKYAPNPGVPALKEAIAAKLRDENGLDYTADDVLVSNGAKHSLFNIMMTICRPGDEVIIPAPYWLSYPEMVKIAGAIPVFVPCREENGLRMTVADFGAAITERTKAVIINSPGNPTGAVYPPEELRAIGEAAASAGLLIVSDEIYEKIVYDGVEQVSVGSLSPSIFANTITVNGFSKAFSMTGWRLGYFAGPGPVVKAAKALQSHSTSGANTFAQAGGVVALKSAAGSVREMVAAFAERRQRIYEGLTAIKGISCVKPSGAFYMFPNIGKLGLEPSSFAERLLEEEAVAVVPGEPFGSQCNVRLSYACGMDEIDEGLARLNRFVASL